MLPSVRRLLQATPRRQSGPAAAVDLPAPLLRALWRSTAQPVAVLTAALPPSTCANHGATLSSLSSVSLAPPLVAFSLRLPSTLATFLLAAPAQSFRVHLLSAAQEDLARAFARPPPPALPPSSHPSPAPFPRELFSELERKALGSLDCTVVHALPLAQFGTGDAEGPQSQLFVARVERTAVPDPGEGKYRGSLVYWEQQYHGVKDE